MRLYGPVGLALLVSAGLTPARSAAGADTDIPAEFPVSTEAVRVDLVVREKSGGFLQGLGPDDVEVLEDGVPQRVESLQMVERGERDGSKEAPMLVAFAFDRLGPQARAFARQTLLGYLDASASPRPLVGLFSLDGNLTPLVGFTDDETALRRAADRLVSTTPRSFAGLREREEMRNSFAGMAEGVGQSHVAAAELPGVPECRGVEADQVKQTEFLAARLSSLYQSLEHDEQGMGTVHGLLALVSSLQDLPGRKAVVFLSEGLALPARVASELRAVISAANRAGVAIYAADAGGLRVASGNDETRRTIETIRTRLEHEVVLAPVAGPGSSVPTAGNMTLLERNEDALRLAPASGLSVLADQTGGFLVQDTNALAPRLLEVNEDLRSYYVLSYTPKNHDFDGRFRKISVRVKRPHGRVQAREGYLAVRSSLPVPALAYEAPALARLESGRLPDQVPVRLRGLSFPETPSTSTVPILVEVDSARLSDFSILVLVRDASGRVVGKTSQRYPASRPGRGSKVLFYRQTQLSPGQYTLTAIAYEDRSGRAGSAIQKLTIPDPGHDRLRASSLMVVRSVEKLDREAPASARSLQYENLLLHPNLGQPLRREDKALAFAITAWPSDEHPGVDAEVEVLRDGRKVAATPATRLHPDADGRIQLVSSLPMSAFSPGRYELRVTLSDGRDAFTRTETVSIAP
jgi:VWFA-related protein